MFGWHDPKVEMPPKQLPVIGKLKHCTTGGCTKATLIHVDETDCAWRTEDGYELSYDWDVAAWRHKGCWLVLLLMRLGLLPRHHKQQAWCAIWAGRDKRMAETNRGLRRWYGRGLLRERNQGRTGRWR